MVRLPGGEKDNIYEVRLFPAKEDIDMETVKSLEDDFVVGFQKRLTTNKVRAIRARPWHHLVPENEEADKK